MCFIASKLSCDTLLITKPEHKTHNTILHTYNVKSTTKTQTLKHKTNNTKYTKLQINHGGFGGKRHRSGSGGPNAFMEVEEVGGG